MGALTPVGRSPTLTGLTWTLCPKAMSELSVFCKSRHACKEGERLVSSLEEIEQQVWQTVLVCERCVS